MTSGVETGTGFWRGKAPIWALWAYPGMAIVGTAVAIVNALTQLSDHPDRYRQSGVVAPLVVEFSSVVALFLLIPLVWRLVRFAPPEPGGWGRFALVHALATLPFSAVHIALFDLIRWLAAKVITLPVCCVAPVDFFYEYRKDLITYAAIVGIMGGARLLEQSLAASSAAASAPEAANLTIKDGARTLRLAPSELIATQAAGNYVEHMLADGRRVLERATMAEAQARLEPHGFLRTHRSWIVNPAAVREIARDGSGDRTLTLSNGLLAPASRRYAEALTKLEPQGRRYDS